mmetsp:Transcript_7726/g.16003  ORF Transcript_7726/g.16003 Transcript_7726/m.16003 type:complete len:130 (+) Transcript_7726:1-390(+)
MVQLCQKGRAMTVIMGVERHNGYKAWQQVVREYEPRLAGRHANMLAALIALEWKEGSDFREQLQALELAVDRYERQSGETLSSALQVAVVSRYMRSEPTIESLRMTIGIFARPCRSMGWLTWSSLEKDF